MTPTELTAEAKNWDLTTNTGALIFSDWLLEQGEVCWANLLRWVAHHCDAYPQAWNASVKGWIDGLPNYLDETFYGAWLTFAKTEKLDIIDVTNPTTADRPFVSRLSASGPRSQ